MFVLDITGPDGRLVVDAVRSFSLHGAEEEFDRMTAVVLTPAPDAAVAALMTQGTVTLHLDTGTGQRVAHRGRVRKIVRRGRDFHIQTIAEGAFGDADGTRTFAPPSRTPCRIADLPGLRDAFAGVGGLDRLDAVVGSVTRFRERELAFLRRLARMSGCVVHCGIDGVEVADPPSGPGRAITSETQVLDTREWGMELEPALAACLVWDAATGEAPCRPESARAPAAGLGGVEAARRSPDPDATDYPFALPPNHAAGPEAALCAAERLDHAFYYRESLTDLSIAAGDVVTLPPGSVVADPLRVVRRELRFPGTHGQAVENVVELRPLAGRPPAEPGTDDVRLHQAEVVHVADADRLGMVAVRFPWQRPGEYVMAAVPQAFGGSFAVPLPGDWVHVLFQPRTVCPPVVLGSVYRGNRPAPTSDGADRVEWRTPEGLLIRLRRTGRTIELAVLDGDTVRAGLTIGPDGIRIVGDVRLLGGKMFFQAAQNGGA